MIFLAAGLSRLEFLPGRPLPWLRFLEIIGLPAGRTGDISIPGNFLKVLIILSWLLFLAWLITFILRPEARKYMLRRLVTYLVWLLLIYGLLTLFQDMTFSEEETAPPQPAAFETPTPEEASPAPPAFVVDPPQWFVLAVSVLLMALLLGGGWFLWQRFRPRPSPLELLAQEAHQTLQELQAGTDLKDTVLRCYRDMSQIFRTQRGIQRSKMMTPREFEQHLARSGLRDEHIQRLTRLFERVRYSARPPGELEEQEAVACLTAIVQVYGQPVGIGQGIPISNENL